MKKLIIASAVASVLTSGFAAAAGLGDTTIDVYTGDHGKSNKKGTQGIIIGQSFGQGTSLAVEATTNKDLDIGVKHTLTFEDSGFYIAPQAGYVFKKNKSSSHTVSHSNHMFYFAGTDNPIQGYGYDASVTAYENNTTSDVFKIGLEAGYKFDNGFFTSARYRVDSNVKNTVRGVKASAFAATVDGDNVRFADATESVSAKKHSRIGRTDLTLGWSNDDLLVQTKVIHKEQIGSLRDWTGNAGTTDYEAKVAYEIFDGIAPYVQYTNKDNAALNKAGNALVREHQGKVGVKFVF